MSENLSHHPNMPNIMGGVGCKTADGTPCNACCGKFYHIKNFKPAGVVCKFVKPNGCGIHNSPEQPKMCKDFHCGDLLSVVKDPLAPLVKRTFVAGIIKILLNQAVEMGVITEDICRERQAGVDDVLKGPNYNLIYDNEE